MSTKHTPGPWDMNCGTEGAVIFHGNVGTIATLTDELTAHQANARLIAAAPELLQLAQDIANGAFNSGDAEHDMPAIVDAARAAIAKAKGE